MAKVTTGTGDTGYTGLLGSGRVPKYDPRPEACGIVDEATSLLGLVRSRIRDQAIREAILKMQRDFYIIMGELATTPENLHILATRINEGHIIWLEACEADFKEKVEIPARFIIPGDTEEGALLDIARSVVRRAERYVVKLQHEHIIDNVHIIRYLNRCSDCLFILARYIEITTGGSTLA
jgi:cob(I)alamin adenosyltransferase